VRGSEKNSIDAKVSAYRVGVDSQSDVSAEIAEADVAAIYPHLKDQHASGRAAEFGWIVAPETADASTRSLPVEERMLGALVAVPGWWRTVLLRVCTAGIAEDELPKVDDPAYWQVHGRCRVEALRLPGTGAELSRRFGIEVLTTPYVLTQQTFELRAGNRARLLLEGGRLWRSTVVTLGGQRADQITVLPDMNAIVADFDCVETPPSPSKPLYEGSTYDPVPVRVWTSEGVTPGGVGNIFAPISFKGCDRHEAPPFTAPVVALPPLVTSPVDKH
jgi:hypothetical protein